MTNVVYDPVEAYLMGVRDSEKISLDQRLTIFDMRLMVQGDELDSPTPATMQDLAQAIIEERVTSEQISFAINSLPLFSRKGVCSYGTSFEFYLRHLPNVEIAHQDDIDRVVRSGNYDWGFIVSNYKQKQSITDRLVQFEIQKRTVDDHECNTVVESEYFFTWSVDSDFIKYGEGLIAFAKKYESKPVIDPIDFAHELLCMIAK